MAEIRRVLRIPLSARSSCRRRAACLKLRVPSCMDATSALGGLKVKSAANSTRCDADSFQAEGSGY